MIPRAKTPATLCRIFNRLPKNRTEIRYQPSADQYSVVQPAGPLLIVENIGHLVDNFSDTGDARG